MHQESFDLLTHHGIKGMRWGVRRFQNKNGTLTSAGRKRRTLQEYRAEKKAAREPHEDYTNAHSKKNIKQMSNKELKDRINRLQMEKQYRDLNPSVVDRGRKLANSTIGNAARESVKSYTQKKMTKGIEKVVDPFLDPFVK